MWQEGGIPDFTFHRVHVRGNDQSGTEARAGEEEVLYSTMHLPSIYYIHEGPGQEHTTLVNRETEKNSPKRLFTAGTCHGTVPWGATTAGSHYQSRGEGAREAVVRRTPKLSELASWQKLSPSTKGEDHINLWAFFHPLSQCSLCLHPTKSRRRSPSQRTKQDK